jgi:hypothetical protein
MVRLDQSWMWITDGHLTSYSMHCSWRGSRVWEVDYTESGNIIPSRRGTWVLNLHCANGKPWNSVFDIWTKGTLIRPVVFGSDNACVRPIPVPKHIHDCIVTVLPIPVLCLSHIKCINICSHLYQQLNDLLISIWWCCYNHVMEIRRLSSCW